MEGILDVPIDKYKDDDPLLQDAAMDAGFTIWILKKFKARKEKKQLASKKNRVGSGTPTDITTGSLEKEGALR